MRRSVPVVASTLLASVLLTACGEDVGAGITRGEDGERAVRQAVITVVPGVLAAAGVRVDEDTALRGGYRRCGDEEGRAQYVAEQTFTPATDPLARLEQVARVLTAEGWTTRGPREDVLTAEAPAGRGDVRAAATVLGADLRLRFEAPCTRLGDDAVSYLLARRTGFVPL